MLWGVKKIGGKKGPRTVGVAAIGWKNNRLYENAGRARKVMGVCTLHGDFWEAWGENTTNMGKKEKKKKIQQHQQFEVDNCLGSQNTRGIETGTNQGKRQNSKSVSIQIYCLSPTVGKKVSSKAPQQVGPCRKKGQRVFVGRKKKASNYKQKKGKKPGSLL